MTVKSCLLFVIFSFVSGNIVEAQNPSATRAAQLSLFALGYGARYFISGYTKAALENPEIKSALEEKLPENLSEPDKREIMARSLTTALLSSLAETLRAIFQKTGFTYSSASALMGAFNAGEKIPLLLKFLRSSWHLGTSMAMTSGELIKQTGYATLSNMKKAVDDFLEVAHAVGTASSLEEAWNQFIKSTQGTPVSDLSYPIKPYHGTALTCGLQDPYCLMQKEKEVYYQVKHDIDVNPDAIAINLGRLFLQTSTISAGLVFAIISYQLGSELAERVAVDLLGPQLPKVVSLIIEKTVRRYSDLYIVDELDKWLLDTLKHADEHLITPKDMKKGIYTGVLTRQVSKVLYPVEKQFIKNLLG